MDNYELRIFTEHREKCSHFETLEELDNFLQYVLSVQNDIIKYSVFNKAGIKLIEERIN